MITEAVAAGMPTAWVAADEVYGDNGAFRAGVAKLGLGYALAVSCTHRIPAWPGGKRRLRADHIAAVLPAMLPGAPYQRRDRLQGSALV